MSQGGADERLRAAFEADLEAIGFGAGQGAFTSAALTYAALLAKWNARIRLVGPSDLATIVREQVVDALGFALAVHALDDEEGFWDVGAGGGLPGILLALRFPERHFALVEPIHKKTAFLSHAAHELGLENVVVHTGRVEADGAVVPALTLPFERPRAALSRATLAPGPWLATARQLVAPGGLVLRAVADAVPEAVMADPHSAPAGRWSWVVPATGAPRSILARRVV